MTQGLRYLRKGAEFVAVGAFVAMFGSFLLQVFTRYVLNRPLGWTSEACVIAYIWVIFWTAAFLLRERDHIAFTTLYEAISPPARRVAAIVGVVAMTAGFIASLPATVSFIAFMRITATPVIRIPFDYVYSVWLLFVLAVILRGIVSLVRLVGPRWRHETGDEPGASGQAAPVVKD